jgi:hypothetical protein
MSQIAQALAKAKERTGQTAAPFLAPGSTAPVPLVDRAAVSATALKQAKNRQRFWLLLALVTLPLTAFVVWFQLRGTVNADIALPSVNFPANQPTPAPMQAEPVKQADLPPRPKPTAVPRAELAQAVANLAITAVTPGDPAKMMLGGRVIRAGETLDSGLTFIGIVDGQLQFTDAAGALYSRRY